MGKLKIIIIVCGIIVVGTIGTVAIISNNKNGKTNNSSPKTQNQILNIAPSKSSTSQSITKGGTENKNKTSANSVASNNNANESSSSQNQESTNQVTATNTTSNIPNTTSSTSTNSLKINSTKSNTAVQVPSTQTNNSSSPIVNKVSNHLTNTNTSTTNVNSNKNLEHDFTFYPATINKNCSLYDAPPNFGGGVSSKLPKGQTVFVNPTSTAQKGWSLTRLPVGAGYLPNSSFTENANTKYLLERVDIPTKLYSKPSKNSTTINLNPQIFKDSYIPNATLVFVQQESNLPNGWSSVFVGVSGTQFKQGYIPTNMLSIY